jgi:tRNA A37 threonylcarbamoyladenosine biosynthesis protein TsaE
LYRLAAESDLLFDLGLNEISEEPDVVLVIEWAERLGFSFNP